MPRKYREEVAGSVYHVFARGVRRRPIFVIEAEFTGPQPLSEPG
ncbi:MAG: hypothetical protein ACJ77Z_10750 [Thermoleophilaceae bacterium]